MAGKVIEKSKIICSSEQPMTELHMITQGRVLVRCPGGSYQIGIGDVVGICEICSDVHFLSYTALEDTMIMTYPVTSMDALGNMLEKHQGIAKIFVLSLFRQFSAMMEQSSVSEINCVDLARKLREDCEIYNKLCAAYNIQPHIPSGVESIQSYLGEDSPDEWLNSYYLALQHLYAGASADILLQEQGLSLGIIRKGSLDFRRTYTVLDEQFQYRLGIMNCYFSESGDDMFEEMTRMYYRLCQMGEDSGELYESIERMFALPDKYYVPKEAKAKERVQNFRAKMDSLSGDAKAQSAGDSSDADIILQLKGSLEKILNFAQLDRETETSFRQHVAEYKATKDKNSADDACSRLRKQLTKEFYTFYTAIFERTLTVSSDLPVPVRMFLYFGYVDEELAGSQNSVILYRLACYMNEPGQGGVYTFYDWLMAIYNGQKSPSRSELDEDYSDFIHQQKRKGNLSAAEITALENSAIDKVRFELQNLFQSANKVTFGRITTFCPLFIKDNVLRDLKDSYITADKTSGALSRLRGIDYSAFYRETIDYEGVQAMNRESVHVEYLPDIILMPNVGIKGTMWQEIEGKKRNSPSRMFISIFHMDDIFTTMVRMAGEFRWELCKRVQGGRWNDITEASLTSEYFDYLQFYKKNGELTKDAKAKVQLGLQKAKNSFKEMFVRDYITWILYEGSGSTRMNKVARRIMFTYCPFNASLDSVIERNPMYTELINRQKVVLGQRIHRLELLKQKIIKNGVSVPDALEKEIQFAARNIEKTV